MSAQEKITLDQEQQKKLEVDIADLKQDRSKLSAALIETSNAIQTQEVALRTLAQKQAGLELEKSHLIHSLESRRLLLAKVLAALQRLGHDPPPALFVQPDNMLTAVRTAIMLGAVVPGLNNDVQALVQTLNDLQTVTQELAAQKQAANDIVEKMNGEHARLSALIDARQANLSQAEKDLADTQANLNDLLHQSASLQDLLTAAQKNANTSQGETGQNKDQKLTPQIAFASQRRSLVLPVEGDIIRRFGTPDAFGGADKGLSIKADTGAIVRAPADGLVAFVGNFRTYGPLLILNMGDGYFIIFAGLGQISVVSGQFVLSGEPIGQMGEAGAKNLAQNSPFFAASAQNQPISFAIGTNKSILYVEFWKNGAAIDSAPWWKKS